MLSLSLYFNKIYYTKALSNQALALAPGWIPLLLRPRMPVSFMFQQQPFTTISSSVVPFSSCLQSFPASRCFPVSQFFASGGQSIGVSTSASDLPTNTQDWFPLGWTGWISLQPRDSQESSPIPQFESINFSALSFLYSPTLTSIHDYWKSHSFD